MTGADARLPFLAAVFVACFSFCAFGQTPPAFVGDVNLRLEPRETICRSA